MKMELPKALKKGSAIPLALRVAIVSSLPEDELIPW